MPYRLTGIPFLGGLNAQKKLLSHRGKILTAISRYRRSRVLLVFLIDREGYDIKKRPLKAGRNSSRM